MSDPQRIYFLGFEIQHIFFTALANSAAGTSGGLLLQSIGFNLDARSNQLGVFKNTQTLAALRNAPANIQQAFAAAGFGWNTQNSTGNADSQVNAHPQYNAFNIAALNRLADDAKPENGNWTSEVKRLAVYDLHRFMANFNASGNLSIQGTTQQQFDQAWSTWRTHNGTGNYKALSTEAAAAIDSYATAFNAAPFGAGEDNSAMRAEIAQNLLAQLEGKLTPEQIAKAQANFDAGNITQAMASLIHDAQLLSSTPVLGNEAAAEAWAAKLWTDMSGFFDFDVLVEKLKGLFDFLATYGDKFIDSITALGQSVPDAIGKSMNAMLVGVGGGVIGDIVEFLNAVYEPAKTAIRTGDWSGVWTTVERYGVAAVISGVVVAATVGVAAFFGGPIAAAFVGAGWAAYGLYDAIDNGIELIGKIGADLGDVALRQLGDSTSVIAVIGRVVANAMDVDFGAPIFAGSGGANSLIRRYLADSASSTLPASVDGTDRAESFFGQNSATIRAGGGNDEIYVRDSVKAYGGAGDDVLAGANARVIAATGQTPTQHMLLDGGAGDDWVLVTGGEGAIAIGGAGDDILYGGGKEAHLHGGSGADSFFIGSSTIIEDADTDGDRVYMGPIRLVGGVKQAWMEGNKAYWAPFSTLLSAFPVIGSELLVTASIFVDAITMKFASYQSFEDGSLGINIGWGFGGVASISDYTLDLDSGQGSGGIAVFEAGRGRGPGSFEQLNRFVNLALYAGFGTGLPGYDPLVLDLDGDGFDLTTEAHSAVWFDYRQDGFAKHTGWLRGDNGFLVRDANGNGQIDNVTEMFGNATTSGFAALGSYDSNNDGVISAADSGYASLQIWQDADGDGVTDAGELKSLSALGIASISLTSAAPATPMVIGGNSVSRVGSFTRSDGSSGAVGDVVFAISDTNTRYLGDSNVNVAAGALLQRSHRVAVAANDNQRSAWREAAFRFAKQLGAGRRCRGDICRACCSYFVSCGTLILTANDNELILLETA